MARYTIDLDRELENKLKIFMEENKIDKRSTAIKRCIIITTSNDLDKSYFGNIDLKLNTILYRLGIYRKILDQLFVNMDFDNNKEIVEDKCLKQIYEEYGKKHFGRLNNE